MEIVFESQKDRSKSIRSVQRKLNVVFVRKRRVCTRSLFCFSSPYIGFAVTLGMVHKISLLFVVPQSSGQGLVGNKNIKSEIFGIPLTYVGVKDTT